MDKQYIVNDQGESVAVVLSIAEYQALLEELDELDAIRVYHERINEKPLSSPREQAPGYV